VLDVNSIAPAPPAIHDPIFRRLNFSSPLRSKYNPSSRVSALIVAVNIPIPSCPTPAIRLSIDRRCLIATFLEHRGHACDPHRHPSSFVMHR